MQTLVSLLLWAPALFSLAASSSPPPSAQDVINKLNLAPNPEGGYYIETFRDPAPADPTLDRAASTAIFYLLARGDRSHWHRLDAAEVWHHYAGAPLLLARSWDNGTGVREAVLGGDVFADQAPQLVVARREWQSAESLGDWSLVGTTVAPGFVPEGFELAPEGWEPR